jgi:hypothetical protein
MLVRPARPELGSFGYFVGIWFSHGLVRTFRARSKGAKVSTSLAQTRTIGSAFIIVSIKIVLTVIFPETHGTDFERTSLC